MSFKGKLGYYFSSFCLHLFQIKSDNVTNKKQTKWWSMIITRFNDNRNTQHNDYTKNISFSHKIGSLIYLTAFDWS